MAAGSRPIRVTLTLRYLTVLTVGLALFSAAVWGVVRQRLLGELERSLSERLSALESFMERETRANTHEALMEEAREFATTLPTGQGLRLWNSDASLVFAVDAAAGPALRRSRRIEARGRRYSAELTAPLTDLNRTLSILGWTLLGSFPLILIASGAAGYWLAGRALAPVDAMTEEARSLGAHDLSGRLTVPEAGDELARLARTWNAMLARIEASVRGITRFTADAAHELRTPVAVIRTSAELALRHERSPESYRQTLTRIERQSRDVGDLLERLLLLARGDAGQWQFEKQPVSLARLLEDLQGVLAPLGESRGISLRWNLPSEGAMVEGDESALRRVVLILADNALKYTPAGGAVEIRCLADPSHVVLEVCDTGPGIAPDHLPHIFERFYRADPARTSGSGAGLGLAIAKAIVLAHGGSIAAESPRTGGALFRITLAAAAVRTEEPAALQTPGRPL